MKNQIEQNKSIQIFLEKVCSYISNPKDKVSIREELLDHLETEIIANIKNGFDFDVAVRLAVDKFGAADKLGKSLKHSRKTVYVSILNFFSIVCAILIVGAYSTAAFMHYTYGTGYESVQKNYEKNIDKFMSDQQELSSIDFLDEANSREKDVGEFLNDKIAWDNSENINKISVPEISNESWFFSNNWLDKNVPKELEYLDLSWIKQVQEYDHWDLFLSGPNSNLLKEASLTNPYSTPMPKFDIISKLSKVYLRKNLDAANIKQALMNVHHLAKLVYTTETLIGSMVAMDILKSEYFSYQRALALNLIKPNELAPFNENQINKMRRMLWAAVGYLDFKNPNIFNQVTKSDKKIIGLCAALEEATRGYIYLAEFYEKIYPLESDSSPQFKFVNKIMDSSKKNCRLSFSRKMLSQLPIYANYIRSTTDASWSIDSITYKYGYSIPFIRQGIAARFISIAVPNFATIYEQ